MSTDFWKGLLALPLGVLVVGLCLVALKVTYLGLGLLGRWGIVHLCHADREQDADVRYTMGAVVASARHHLVINRGTTGVVFFTGEMDSGDEGAINRRKWAMHHADYARETDA